MEKILVVGAFKAEDENAIEFVKQLGILIAKSNLILLNGCQNELDKLIAETVNDELVKAGVNPESRIINYITAESKPSHKFGRMLKSKLKNWGIEQEINAVPEQFEMADAIILIGGQQGTRRAAHWARNVSGVPLLPVACFGGTAERIYDEELSIFENKYGDRIERFEFEILNQFITDWGKLAHDVLDLAEKIAMSKHVFVIMSFSRDEKLEDAFDTFKGVCEEFGYECVRVDEKNTTGRIIPEIFLNIKKSAFCITDLTEEKPNVYYELGYAQGQGKHVIVTAYENSELPFDVKDIPVIFWKGQKQLRENLRMQIKEIAIKQGRKI
jgi:hypothetical protein